MAVDRALWERFRAAGREGELIERELGLHWEDLRFPVQAINPPGAESDPDVDATDGTLLFAAAGTEVIYIQAQMPHAWALGSAIVPHVHWCKTSSAAGAVVWQLAYQFADIGEAFGDWSSAVSATLAVSDGDTANVHALSSFGPLTLPANGVSSMIKLKLSRAGNDAADTYAADAKLLEFDIHYQVDSRGSDEETSK
jgi:hypothetical protein